ncbi:cation:proton antiporter [Dyella sp.]|jgi:NhaP-type Na+/H+ or K+/H+ antiporter|uniref:cation:proton antiporter n=1 Tax=Dyella sp. TaxID=1869338 RepID=UPI002D7A1373|nr:cation:proton antiporter [Dyella sp.]HET6433115.1 cation:proton antiporter [Dyella sp.]
MGLTAWIAACGVLLLLAGLATGWIRRLPITSFWIFLAAGVVGGPWFLDQVWIDFPKHPEWVALASELALVVSLFIGGLKLRVGFRHVAWRTAWRLAFPAMLLCIGGVCVAMHLLFGTPWELALLCGAMIAPTDPVLASIVAVDDASDHDAMRGALSGEAGLNDGAALPFLILALLLLDHTGSVSDGALGHWFFANIAWSLPVGVAVGGGIGWGLGLLGTRIKSLTNDTAPSDFLAMAIMMLAYAAAESLSASTFLAAFSAGVGLRHAELMIVARHPHRHGVSSGDQASPDDVGGGHAPAEFLVKRGKVGDESGPAESIGRVVFDALSFGDTLERILAAVLVFATGAAVARHWSLQAIAVALLLFVLVRPLSVYLSTVGAGIPRPRRLLMGWLGVRGIGTINYMAYALTHGLNDDESGMVTALAITTVVLSVVLHGVTARPLMRWRGRRMREHEANS